MNFLIITGTLLEIPQLAYLQNDRQTPYTTFGIRFPDPNPKTNGTYPLRIYVYGKNAEDLINSQYVPGDTLLVEGRVDVATVEKDGYKEQRATVNASRIQRLAPASVQSAPPSTAYQQPVQAPPAAPPQPVAPPPQQTIPVQPIHTPPPAPQPVPQPQTQAPPPPAQAQIPLPADPSLDEIPF